MKKVLLGTTAIFGVALIGQAMAADKPSISMSGNMKFEAAFVDEDDNSVNGTGDTRNNRGYKFYNDDAEIVFTAKTTADNGLEYGAKIEYQFEENEGGAQGTDEAVIWLEGGWGLLQLGNEDGVEDAYRVGGWSVLGGTGGHDGEFFVTNNASALISTGQAGDTSDASKVTYYTPSFSGFKAGVSFTPDSGHEYDAAPDDEGTDTENNIAIGLEYKGEFDQVGVHVAGRYVTAEYESNDDVGANTEQEEVSSFALGTKVTFGEFAIGVGYVDNGDSGVTKAESAAGLDAGKWYDVGASYQTGPYKVAVAYFHSEKQTAATTEAEADVFTVTGDYNVAPGLDVYAEYLYAELEDGASATANDNEASTFIIGTKVSF